MMKLVAKFGCVSDKLYFAMYYYKTCRYRKALSLIDMTRVDFTQPYVVCIKSHVNRETYTEVLRGKSLSSKMRQAKVGSISLNTHIDYINELKSELLSSRQNGIGNIYIPPYVFLNFLEFLCYRHINKTLSQAALDELQVLVHFDQGLFGSYVCRDISWEILGICQQISGNPQAALYSYQQSLAQSPLNKIQSASQWRIHCLTG